jgi:hypothetical protein
VLTDEIAGYLVTTGLGLTTAPPNPNLFAGPFPLGGPDEAVCLVPWNTSTVDTFGESLSAPAMEMQNFKVISRGKRDKAKAAETKAYAVYKKLRRLGPVTLSGVKYHHIEAQPPIWLSDDETGRPRFHFDCTAFKAESP